MPPSSLSPRAPRWTALLWPLLLALAVLVVFWPAHLGQFLLWDDDINLRDNPHLRALTLEHLRWMFTDMAHMRRYVPLTWLNWAVEHALFGLTPTSTHVGNILLHAVNTLLVFALARRLLPLLLPASAAAPTATSVRVAAAIAALLWALHPLRVEPVAWASGRIYCVAAFFLLLSTLAYVHSALAPPGAARRTGWLAASLGAYLASLLTYPLGLTFVGVLLVLDALVLRRLAPAAAPAERTRVWLEKAAFAFLALVLGLVTVWAAAHAQGTWEPPVSLKEFGIVPRLAQAFYVWGYYVWRPFLPLDLSPVYATLFDFKPQDWPFVANASLVALVTTALVLRRRQSPRLLALWLCHLCLLVPLLGLTEHPHYPSDRYSYLVALPWCLGAAALCLRTGVAQPRRHPVWFASLLLALAALGVLTTRQIAVWRDSETLFRHMLAQLGDHPYRADLYRRLGTLYLDQGKTDAAAEEYHRALQVDPREVFAHLGLGKVDELQGRLPEAAESYRRAVRLKPNLAEGYLRLGYVLYQLNRLPEAAAAFQSRLRLLPADAGAHLDYAAALLRLGRASEALPHCEEAIRLRPDNPINFLNLGSALVALGRTAEAVKAYEATLRLQPRSAAAHFALGRILQNTGQRSAAASHFQAALELKPDLAEARAALRQLGNPAPPP